MKRNLTLGVALALLAGCRDMLPTDVARAPGHVGMQADVMTTGTIDLRANALGGIDDVLDRIVPALSDRAAAHSLEAALGGLRTAFENNDVNGVPAVVDAARSAVDRYARTDTDLADVDAIRLALDYAAAALAAD